MMENEKFFRPRLEKQLVKIRDMDLQHTAEVLGLQGRGASFVIDFFNRRIRFEKMTYTDEDNKPLTDAVQWVLSTYMIMCPEQRVETSHRLVSFREFDGAGILFSRFASNTSKIIETTFSGKAARLKERCVALGAVEVQSTGYDVTVRFRALSRIPILLNFNDAEEGLPAMASFLFHDNAQCYLDLECMTVLSTYLTGELIRQI
jgi:hypothetical protein